jgi:hypothetical protein
MDPANANFFVLLGGQPTGKKTTEKTTSQIWLSRAYKTHLKPPNRNKNKPYS